MPVPMNRAMSDDPASKLTPALLLRGYAAGIFPMAESRDDPDIYWVEPKRRAILPLDRFHLSRSLRKTVARDRFRVTAHGHFAAVLEACAASAPGRENSWINRSIADACIALNRRGFAHAIGCWQGDELVGGLYGIALGRAFFGESMFSRRTDASKVALAHLVARLRVGGFDLLDCQFMTEHLASMGAVEIDRSAYLERLQRALSADSLFASAPFAAGAGAAGAGALAGADAGSARWGALDRLLASAAPTDGPAVSSPSAASGSVSPGQRIVQLLTNTS